MSDLPNEEWRAVISRPLETQPFVPTFLEFRVEMGAASVCGKCRPQNTDHYLAVRLGRTQQILRTSLAAADLPPRFEERSYAMLVADGVAGHSGVRASRLALSALAHLAVQYGKWNVRIDPDTAADILAQSRFFYARAHDALRQASRADARLANMATSLTALYIAEDSLFFAHVGHSAAFVFRDGVLIQLTASHTTDRDRSASAFTDGLTKTIGRRRSLPHIDTEHIRLLTGDRLLLCTDGLTAAVTKERIADTLASRRAPQEDCDRLIDLAAAEQVGDDVTILLADYTLPRARTGRPPNGDTDLPSPHTQAE
jgi:serine/threonine protein phosphatase PrpC